MSHREVDEVLGKFVSLFHSICNGCGVYGVGLSLFVFKYIDLSRSLD